MGMITSALVETSHGSGRYDRLVRHAIKALDAAGIPWEETSLKFVQRDRVEVRPDTLVVGSIPIVHAALRQLGCPAPEPDDYPEELRYLLRRRVWQARLLQTKAGDFVKSRQVKRFTGFVYPGYYDPVMCNGASRNTPVWVSEPVKWVSEWRCFVARGSVVGKQWYDGDPEVGVDDPTLQKAIRSRSDAAPWGYALDLGVLDTGETALVEQNLGYSLDHYRLPPDAYLTVLDAYWHWATRSAG